MISRFSRLLLIIIPLIGVLFSVPVASARYHRHWHHRHHHHYWRNGDYNRRFYYNRDWRAYPYRHRYNRYSEAYPHGYYWHRGNRYYR